MPRVEKLVEGRKSNDRTPIRHVFQAARFFGEAADYVHPDQEAVAEAGSDASRQISIHRRIVAAAVVFGLIGAAGGVGMMVLAASHAAPKHEWTEFLMAPALFGMM